MAKPSAERGGREATTLDRVVGDVVRGIREGRYAPGQRMVEADLVEELGASRNSVREALRVLEAQGLVEVVPHRGARVRSLGADDIRQVYEVFAVVMSGAARLAALRIGEPGHRQRLRGSVAALRKAAARSDPIAYMDAVTAFDDTILALTMNRQLAGLLDTMRLQVLRYTAPPFIRGVGEVMTRSLADHRAVADRIASGDADGAMEAMRTHVEWTTEIVLDALASNRIVPQNR